jgi:hypothetical protein
MCNDMPLWRKCRAAMPALHLEQSALVHVNALLVQAVLEVPGFHDLIGPDERVIAAFGYYLWGGTATRARCSAPGPTSG